MRKNKRKEIIIFKKVVEYEFYNADIDIMIGDEHFEYIQESIEKEYSEGQLVDTESVGWWVTI